MNREGGERREALRAGYDGPCRHFNLYWKARGSQPSPAPPSDSLKLGEDVETGKHFLASRRISRGQAIFTERPIVTVRSRFFPMEVMGLPRQAASLIFDEIQTKSYGTVVSERMNKQMIAGTFVPGRLKFRALLPAKLRVMSCSAAFALFGLFIGRLGRLDKAEITRHNQYSGLLLRAFVHNGFTHSSYAGVSTNKLWALVESRKGNFSTLVSNTESHKKDVMTSTASMKSVTSIYRHASLLNHSCAPSAAVYIDPHTNILTLSALRDIDVGDPVTISYLPLHDLMDSTLERVRILLQRNIFYCRCPRCSDVVDRGNTYACQCSSSRRLTSNRVEGSVMPLLDADAFAQEKPVASMETTLWTPDNNKLPPKKFVCQQCAKIDGGALPLRDGKAGMRATKRRTRIVSKGIEGIIGNPRIVATNRAPAPANNYSPIPEFLRRVRTPTMLRAIRLLQNKTKHKEKVNSLFDLRYSNLDVIEAELTEKVEEAKFQQRSSMEQAILLSQGNFCDAHNSIYAKLTFAELVMANRMEVDELVDIDRRVALMLDHIVEHTNIPFAEAVQQINIAIPSEESRMIVNRVASQLSD